jgi:hypothetical protein
LQKGGKIRAASNFQIRVKTMSSSTTTTVSSSSCAAGGGGDENAQQQAGSCPAAQEQPLSQSQAAAPREYGIAAVEREGREPTLEDVFADEEAAVFEAALRLEAEQEAKAAAAAEKAEEKVDFTSFFLSFLRKMNFYGFLLLFSGKSD